MLPNAADNVAQPQAICESAQRLMEVGQEWEAVRSAAAARCGRRRAPGRARAAVQGDDGRHPLVARRDVEMALDVRAGEERVAVLADELREAAEGLSRTLYVPHHGHHREHLEAEEGDRQDHHRHPPDPEGDQSRLGRRSRAPRRWPRWSSGRTRTAGATRDGPITLSDIRQCFELISLVSQIGLSEREAQDIESRSKQLQQRTSSNSGTRCGDLQQVKRRTRADPADRRP